MGLVGHPVEIESEVSFDTATICFEYDPAKLGDTNEDDLRVMWFDEENCEFVVLEDSVIDKTKHTVSYVTTHFSRYNLVDKTDWEDTWTIYDTTVSKKMSTLTLYHLD